MKQSKTQLESSYSRLGNNGIQVSLKNSSDGILQEVISGSTLSQGELGRPSFSVGLTCPIAKEEETLSRVYDFKTEMS